MGASRLPARSLVLGVAALVPAALPGVALADLKRPHDAPASRFEIGAYLIHQRGLDGLTETGTYVPLKWTGFHSGVLDWKFEGAVTYFSKPGDDWRAFEVAPGFRYWIDPATSVTPFVRLGIARAKTGDKAMFAYGADVLFQRSFTVDPGAAGVHRLVLAEAQAGFMAYEGRGQDRSSSYGFVSATAAYDWPLGGPDAGQRRAKLGAGVEVQFGSGRAVDHLFLATLSLRSEEPGTGRLLHKIDLSGGAGTRSTFRLGLGYMRGF